MYSKNYNFFAFFLKCLFCNCQNTGEPRKKEGFLFEKKGWIKEGKGPPQK